VEDANDIEHPRYGTAMSDEAWTAEKAMNKLRNALKEKGTSVAEVFSQFDTDGDGTINGPELHHGLRDVLGDILSPGQISDIIVALDADVDNRINLQELQAAMSEEE
tara:strand:+ start:55 stop:375 length:321 start_codon:yes stop_codon:yes gene_type:complete